MGSLSNIINQKRAIQGSIFGGGGRRRQPHNPNDAQGRLFQMLAERGRNAYLDAQRNRQAMSPQPGLYYPRPQANATNVADAFRQSKRKADSINMMNTNDIYR
jgi:hypothetical protein